MRKTILFRAALFALALMLLLGGASGAVFADGSADGSADVVWSVSAKDAEGHDLTLVSAEDVENSLGKGFALDCGKDAQGTPITEPKVDDLRRGGMKITPPAGYAVSSVFLVADGASRAEGSRSLLLLAQASADGSGAVTLPAAIFAEGYDSSAVGTVFNGSGSRYVLQIALDRIASDAQVTVNYTAGSLADVLGDTALVAGGNTAVFPIDADRHSASFSVAALDAAVADSALRTLGKQFTGWKMSLSNGARAAFSGGESVSLSSSATFEAQWKDVIVFAFTGGEKLYDGTPLTASYTRSGDVKGGDVLEVPDDAFALSRTEPGETEATLDLSRVRVTRDGADVTGEYEFTVIPATLRVVQRGVSFTVSDAQKEYDGTPLVPSNYSFDQSVLVEGHTVSAAFSGQQTVPGSSTGSAVFTISDADGRDVTGCYNVSVINGMLTVTARSEKQPITVTIKEAEKEYDGQPLNEAGYSVTDGSLLGSDTLSVQSFSGGITEVGTGSLSAAFSVLNGGTDVSDNYSINVVPGKMTVRPRAIVLTADSAEKEYDGTALTKDSFSLSSGSLVSGHSVSAKVSGSQTAAGSSANKIVADSVKITDGSGRDLTEMYSVRLVDGTLTVKNVSSPTAITITMKSAEKVYDGKALSSKDYEISSGKLAEGDELTIGEVRGEQLDVGESSVTASFTVKRGNSDVTAKYTLTIVAGKLTVKARPVAVTMKDAQKEYDGNVLSSKAYEISSGTIAEGDTLTIGEVKGEQLGVGESSVTASFTVKRGENDVTGNYTLTVVPGRLTVKPRSIVLTADSAEKDYDGKALTKDSFSVTSGSLVSGHSISATVSGSQTAAGSSANKIDAASVKITDGSGKILTGMYSIRLVDGTLTVKGINQTAITITMKSAEKVYDGKVLTSKDYEITSGKLADGDTLTVGEVKGEQLGAGESSVTASFTVKHGANDVTASYAITVVPGKLTVKPRPITITADSASKVYDGRALTRDSWKLTTGELVKGHTLTASVSGSQTDLGSSANVVVKNSIKIVDSEKKDVTANYEITTAAGTLTVNRDPITAITLTVGDGSKVYDGKPYRFIAADIRVTSGTLPAGYTIDATFNPEAPTDVGKYEVTIKSVTIRNASGADVTSQFNITRARGTLTITERPLVISTKAANKVYDGTPLTERSTPSISGRVEGHQVTLRITGSQTKVGSSENTVSDVKITDKETGADVTKNYAISYQYGLLTVTEADGGDTAADPYTWVSGSTGTLFIKFDHDYEGFEGLQIDGKDVDRSNYTSASGSTEIWLKASFLNTLSSGSHKLTAKYAGGEKAETSFAIKGTQGTRTGDNSRLGLWIFIMAAALLASFAAAWYLFLGKDRRWKTKPITFRKRK